MRKVLLIAANFLREARWYIVVMLAWIVGMAAIVLALGNHPSRDDVLFLVRQEAVYGLAFALFTGSNAIRTDRRTRRILSLLSKAVERRQYIAGLLLGTAAQSALYFTVVALCAAWLGSAVGWASAPVWRLVLPMTVVCALLAGAALLFASFLHPLLAVGAASLWVLAQFWLEHVSAAGGSRWLPLKTALRALFTFHLPGGGSVPWEASVAALVEAVVLWLIAAAIFERRDIAVAVD